ncbi:MAG: radical SAM protein [Candidatus Peregrinibacteria bacterium GW2011_GWC2_39_14]|nr:MAG: Radical SAM domain protein [Candidatus Peregrinibacteria bacterium GW2011_GWA2_38_36]KKR06559.1 MAG: radical SAM protein [Candidatus Peregrinibacteria bacterium GW2011_GWC2_39_14]
MSALPLNEKIPVIKGLDLSNTDLKKAQEENKMLLMDIETSNICNLKCRYCFRDVYGGHDTLKNELTLEQRFKLFDQAKELGCRTLKISGAGEPLIDKLFWPMVDYANKLGMTIISFTNGMVIDKAMAKKLYEKNVSLIVKCNSRDPKVEDFMTGRDGYALKRNKAIDYLIELGFNKTKPTRLGLDAVITKYNIKEIIPSLRFCRQNNIMPIFRPMMPIGAAISVKDWEITREETIKLYEKALEMDRKEFDLDYELTLPYIGGLWCRQLNYAVYTNILGEVYMCTGSRKKLGDVKKQTLSEIWNSKEVQRIRNTPYSSCPMRENYWAGKKEYDCL